MKGTLLLLLTLLMSVFLHAQDNCNYLIELYNNINSPSKQEYFRVIGPMSVIAAYIQQPPVKISKTVGINPDLPEETKSVFVEWVKKQYGTIENLNKAYNIQHVLPAQDNQPFTLSEDFDNHRGRFVSREYRHLCDIFRFKTDIHLESVRKNEINRHNSFDPVPVLTGHSSKPICLIFQTERNCMVLC